MGSCYSFCRTSAVISCSSSNDPAKELAPLKNEPTTTIVKFALKFPNGLKGIEFINDQVVPHENINTWLSDLYANSAWDQWIIYNDETGHLGDNHHRKGHCKGILAWSGTRISWLCHSIPNFPRNFDGKSISDIEKGETIYGQSLQYIEIPFTDVLFEKIMNQLYIMDPHIFNVKIPSILRISSSEKMRTKDVSAIYLSKYPPIVHLAKSPFCNIDIYGDYITNYFDNSGKWKVETWIRGHRISKESDLIEDVIHLQFENTHYTETQDHSKWAVSEKELYAVGDLNRMTSQFHRGGGMFICTNPEIAKSLRNLIT
jgi:hypothetical protein